MVTTRSHRRGLPSAAYAAACLLALAGCGDDDADAAAGRESAPRVVDTPNGDVEVPAEPRTVATLNWTVPAVLVDLGITPVAIPNGQDDPAATPARYVDALAEVPRIGDWNTLDFEAILGLEPDLIVGDTWDNYERASDIAPTVETGSDGGWQGIAATVAEAVGRTAELAELAERYDERLAALKDEYEPELTGNQWVSVSGTADGQWLHEQRLTPTGALLASLGATLLPISDVDGWWSDPYAMEALDELTDADVILYTAMLDGEPVEMTRPVLDHPLFAPLPAVRAGRVYGFGHGAMTSYGWAMEALDDLEDILADLRAA